MTSWQRLRLTALVAGCAIAGGVIFVSTQGPGEATQFNDSHFHLTNYVQEGISGPQFLKIMGNRVSRSTLVRHSSAAAMVVRELGRVRAHLLPADRCTSLLLLVHRRAYCERLPLIVEGTAGAIRSDDHRIQSGRHVCGRSHPAGPPDVPWRLHRARRVHDSQGIRLLEDLGRNRQPDQSSARSHSGFCRGSRPRLHPSQRRRHAVRQDGRRPGLPRADESASQAPSEDLDHLGAYRPRPDCASDPRVGGGGRANSGPCRHRRDAGQRPRIRPCQLRHLVG